MPLKAGIKKILYICVSLSWLVVMGLLVDRYYFHRGQESDVGIISFPPMFFEEHWMGMYLHGEKAGYMFSKITPFGDGYRVEGALKMRLNILNEEKTVETAITARLGRTLKLVSFDSKLTS